jgi:hypothetical protein
MEALSGALEARALEIGFRGISANAVTSHDISQKMLMHHEYKSCGLELAAAPHAQFKALVKENYMPQRESLMHCFKYISPPSPVVAHVPPRHRDIVGRIYENLGQPFRLGDPAPSSSPGDYQINFDRLQKGLIRVISSDLSQWPIILRATEDLEKFGGAEVINLDLPLAQPASALICELAEKAGFIFSCVRPCEAKDGDNLRLQRLTVPLDMMNRLCIYSDFGRVLFDYVTAQMAAART